MAHESSCMKMRGAGPWMGRMVSLGSARREGEGDGNEEGGAHRREDLDKKRQTLLRRKTLFVLHPLLVLRFFFPRVTETDGLYPPPECEAMHVMSPIRIERCDAGKAGQTSGPEKSPHAMCVQPSRWTNTIRQGVCVSEQEKGEHRLAKDYRGRSFRHPTPRALVFRRLTQAVLHPDPC